MFNIKVHYYCRSSTTPIFKSWEDISKLEAISQVRKRNLSKLSKEQTDFYDRSTPLKESYHDWLLKQSQDVQLKHLGDYKAVEAFQTGKIQLNKFTNDEGNSIGINELRALTTDKYTVPGDSITFANARARLDAMKLYATTPDDFINDAKLTKTLKDYYLLQSGELDGTLSLTNFRGALIHTKKAMKNRVLTVLPTEAQLKFNPITNRYEDVRLYQPNPSVFFNNLRLVDESDKLLDRDKEFIKKFVTDLSGNMSMNETAAVTDNLRIIFGRYRDNAERWSNFKAVTQGQIKFDVMNVSDAIETQIRKDSDVFKKLLQEDFLDPVLGPTQLKELSDTFIDNILAKNKWENKTAPLIARELRGFLGIQTWMLPESKYTDTNIPLKLRSYLSESALQQFYLKFSKRLALADCPDRDQFAVNLGRDLYNLANQNGSRMEWYKAGMSVLNSRRVKNFYEIETFN